MPTKCIPSSVLGEDKINFPDMQIKVNEKDAQDQLPV